MLKKMIVMLAACLVFAASFQAHAAKTVIAVNCGGGEAYPFVADRNFTGGNTAGNTRPITMTGVTNPAPQSVYQSERWGVFSYNFGTVDGLAASTTYKVRLHFAENYNGITQAQQRLFSIDINRTRVITDLDVYQESGGGQDRALVKEFDVTTTGSAQIRIQTVANKDNPKLDGIEIIDPNANPDSLRITPADVSTSGFTQHATSVTLSVFNMTSAAVTVNNFRVVGSNVFTPPTAPLTIAAQTTATVVVNCRSSFTGVYNALLYLDYGTPTMTVQARLRYASMPYTMNWNDIDVGGSPLVQGSATPGTGNFTLINAGRDIWDNADQFNYMYRSTIGNFTLTANVASLEATNAWTKGGIMVRESPDADSRMIFIAVTPSNGLAFQYRRNAASGCADVVAPIAGVTAPVRVRLVRSGNTFTGSYTKDGTTWTTLGSINLTMSPNAAAGLCLTSHDVTKTATGVFDNVALDYVADPRFVINAVKNWSVFE